jgi:hypothetical protein
MRADLGRSALSFLEANKRFHDVIAWSSGNVLFGYIVDSLLGIMDGAVMGIHYPPHRRQAILVAHEEIYAALAARDPALSQARMQEHIDAYVKYAERKYPQLLQETTPGTSATSADRLGWALPAPAPLTLRLADPLPRRVAGQVRSGSRARLAGQSRFAEEGAQHRRVRARRYRQARH